MNPIRKHLSQVSEGMTLLDEGEVQGVIEALRLIRTMGGTVYVCGNGGSGALASHFANDLLKMARVKAVCLNDMVPSVSAYGNDTGWQNMFAGPLGNLLEPGRDAVLGISCSGNSLNVIRALESAGNCLTMGLTGQDEGSLINNVDGIALVHARVPDIRVQEDIHSIVCHAVARALQEEE